MTEHLDGVDTVEPATGRGLEFAAALDTVTLPTLGKGLVLQ